VVDAVGGIYQLSRAFEDQDWSLRGESLTVFLVLAHEWEDEPEKRSAIEADMQRELRCFLERGRRRS
jgi:hypothetical protein